MLAEWVPQFNSPFWKAFRPLQGATVSLSLRYHTQANGLPKRVCRDSEVRLDCLIFQNPASWLKILIWVQFAHKTFPNAFMGIFTLPLCLHASVSAVSCPGTWGQDPVCDGDGMPLLPDVVKGTLDASVASMAYRKKTDQRSGPASVYVPRQKVWVSIQDPLLHVESHRLSAIHWTIPLVRSYYICFCDILYNLHVCSRSVRLNWSRKAFRC